MELPESIPMNDGDSSHSYAKYSRYQRAAVEGAKQMIHEAVLEKLNIDKYPFCDSSIPFQIADMGCSTGPNTFIAVQNIIDAIDLKYKSKTQNLETPEYQVHFNDHKENDFNTLFKSLPTSSKYFATGVPGTFYSRLFPKNTLHFVHSSFALHFLSKVPKEVVDSESTAFNKGRIVCTGDLKEVAEAYLAQYNKDMDNFLSARAQEIVEGGLMVISVPGLPNGVHLSKTSLGMMGDLLGSCLMDMAKMGLISQEKVDSFNLPLYFATPQEMETVVNKNGYFSIERMEIVNNPVLHLAPNIQFVVSSLRAIIEWFTEKCFGNVITEKLFEYFTKKLQENMFVLDKKNHKNIDLYILLKHQIKRM